jgi:hypothetical protein
MGVWLSTGPFGEHRSSGPAGRLRPSAVAAMQPSDTAQGGIATGGKQHGTGRGLFDRHCRLRGNQNHDPARGTSAAQGRRRLAEVGGSPRAGLRTGRAPFLSPEEATADVVRQGVGFSPMTGQHRYAERRSEDGRSSHLLDQQANLTDHWARLCGRRHGCRR